MSYVFPRIAGNRKKKSKLRASSGWCCFRKCLEARKKTSSLYEVQKKEKKKSYVINWYTLKK